MASTTDNSLTATGRAGVTQAQSDASPDTKFHLDTFTVSASGATCHKTATAGSSPNTLISQLSPGQTGCFPTGTYGSTGTQITVNKTNITLRSTPGQTATLLGRMVIGAAGSGSTIRELRLDGVNPTNLPSPTVDGATNVTIAANNISNRNPANTANAGICITPNDFSGPPANGFLIERNRLHDCGRLLAPPDPPRTNHDHAVYVDGPTSGFVRYNAIYDVADRGVSLHYDPANIQVYNNTIDGNGRGIHFGDGSTNNRADRNVVTNSLDTGGPGGGGYNLTRYANGSGNSVHDSCLKAGNPNPAYNTAGGIAPDFAANVTLGFWINHNGSDPYVNRAGKDFRIKTTSPCYNRGWGAPDDIARP
jgi:hypothetical protein